MKQGVIRYDDKHDSYFVQSGRQGFTLFLFTPNDRWLGREVWFEHTSANEVTKLSFNPWGHPSHKNNSVKA